MPRLSYVILFWLIALTQRPMCFSQANTNLGRICQALWNEDKNRVVLGKDYQINTQGAILNTREVNDKAPSLLFYDVDANILNKPTFKSFLALIDNYNRFTGKPENTTPVEVNETWRFIQDISKTGPIVEVHKYLVKRQLVPAPMKKFQERLYDIWFNNYGRRRQNDSSGFEHVFVGEVSRGKVTGLHNWLQLLNLENKKQIDYRGYYLYHSPQPVRLKIKFYWEKYKKRISSFFVGTSPEFEMAIYTLCFVVRPGKGCRCRINGGKLTILTTTNRRTGRVQTAYPSL